VEETIHGHNGSGSDRFHCVEAVPGSASDRRLRAAPAVEKRVDTQGAEVGTGALDYNNGSGSDGKDEQDRRRDSSPGRRDRKDESNTEHSLPYGSRQDCLFLENVHRSEVERLFPIWCLICRQRRHTGSISLALEEHTRDLTSMLGKALDRYLAIDADREQDEKERRTSTPGSRLTVRGRKTVPRLSAWREC